uniref:Peptidase S1 domain-containing protein n=1 Tax=Pristionchus pacificus TaxID=54126 RepID=A0A8R1YRI5_PRIPA
MDNFRYDVCELFSGKLNPSTHRVFLSITLICADPPSKERTGDIDIVVLLLPSICSSLGPYSFLPRFDQNEHRVWIERCGLSDVESGKHIGWFVAVHNKDTQSYNGAAVITPKNVVTARSSVTEIDGPTPIESLELLVFTSINMTGIDTTKLPAPHYLELTAKYKIAHVIIPTVSKEKNVRIPSRGSGKKSVLQIYIFAMIQIEDSFPENLNHACLPSQSEQVPAKSHVHVFHLCMFIPTSTAERVYQKIPIEFGVHHQICDEEKSYCEERLNGSPAAQGMSGDIWFRHMLGGDVLLGIGLGDGTAVSIEFWGEFICKMTGACMHGFEVPSPLHRTDFPFYLDGEYHPFMRADECTAEHQLNLIRQSTPFTRLTRTEQRSLKQECGKSVANKSLPNFFEMDNAFAATLVTRKKDTKDILSCAGVLISPLHVLSTSSCLLHALEESGSVLNAIFPPKTPDWSHEEFPFQKEYLYDWHYLPVAVGKLWILVEKNDYDLAIVQLEKRIPIESYIKPICINPEVLWNPSFRMIHREEVKKPNSKRFILEYSGHDIPESKSDGEENEKDEHNIIQFTTNVSVKMEHRGSVLISTSSDPQIPKNLIGFVVEQDDTPNPFPTRAIRVEYFSTFICIHTGVCKDGEKFERRLFASSFLAKDLKLMNGVGHKYGKTASGLLHEKEMDSIIRILTKEEPIRLTAEQNRELQAVCGKKPSRQLWINLKIRQKNNRMFGGEEFAFADWPWAVYLGVELDSPNTGDSGVLHWLVYFSASCHYCSTFEGGPFSENKQIIVMYGGTQWNSAPETFKRVGIRKKIYPMSNEETLWHEQDIGVGELEHEIEGNSMAMFCMPKKEDISSDQFEKKAHFFGGGMGENSPYGGDQLKMLTYSLTDPDIYESPWLSSTGFFMSYRATREKHGYSGRGDSGGPLLRKRLVGDRYVLYGVLSGSNRTCDDCRDGWQIWTNPVYFLPNICRITGICPDEPAIVEPVGDVAVDGKTLYSSIITLLETDH